MRQHLYRWGWVASVIAVVASTPREALAVDPIVRLKEGLNIIVPKSLAEREKRSKLVSEAVAILAENRSISELRRAYFLKEWGLHSQIPLGSPVTEAEKEIARDAKEIEGRHKEIGKLLISSIAEAAKEASDDGKSALGILIAEMADAEVIFHEKGQLRPKFTRELTHILCGMAKEKNPAIKQAALYALGKITPDLTAAMPVLQEEMSPGVAIEARWHAAHALANVARNARSLEPAERLRTIDTVIESAAIAMRDPNDDEKVRGYCLQAIHEAGKTLGEHFDAAEATWLLEIKGKRSLAKSVKDIFQTCQTSTPRIVGAAHEQDKPNLRVAALRALDAMVVARAKFVQRLEEGNDKQPGGASGYFKELEARDPIAEIGKGQEETIAGLLASVGRLTHEKDVRLRLGAIGIFETLGEEAEPAAGEISEALRDPDRFVRAAATRTLRKFSPGKIGPRAIEALGALLVDPDPDLSKDAAGAIEALGPTAAGTIPSLGFLIASAESSGHHWDADNRVAAMKALVSVGGASVGRNFAGVLKKQGDADGSRVRYAAQQTYPQLLIALKDSNLRVRRAAADTIAGLGVPIPFSNQPEHVAETRQLVQRILAGLKEALRDDDAEVRQSASEAILIVGRR